MPKHETLPDPVATARTPERVGRYRWTICALLFFATTINYVDRQVLGILAPDLQKSLHWSEAQYGNIVAAISVPGEREKWFGFLGALRNVGFALGGLLSGLAITIGTDTAYAAVVVATTSA